MSSSPQGWSEKGGGGQFGRFHPLLRAGFCLLGFALVGALAFGVAPTLPRFLHIDDEIQTIKESGIRAGAIFYSEVEQIPAIESLVRGAARGNRPTERTDPVPPTTGR